MTDETLPSPAAAAPGNPDRRSDEILVAFAPAAPQRRLTVLVRLILVIPHTIALYVLTAVTELVVIAGWFAALFTGRLPGGMADFITGWLRWWVRVYGYAALLTGRYPPFEFADADYPVRVQAIPGRLNRLAVFFRLLLAIPAAIVAFLAASGMSLALIVAWVIVLVTGTMPQPLHQAIAATLRYFARCYGYNFLLTGTYPAGLFGDRLDGSTAGAGPALETAGPPPVPPGAGWAPSAGPVPGYGQPGYLPSADTQSGAAALWPPSAGPGAWQLILSPGARRLVGLFLGLGVFVLAGSIALAVVLTVTVGNSAVQRANAVLQVEQAHSALITAVTTFQSDVANCKGALTCVTSADAKAGQAFATFGAAVKVIGMPDAKSASASAVLQRDAAAAHADFSQLAGATSVSQYQQIAASSGLSQMLSKFDADYRTLGVALGAITG